MSGTLMLDSGGWEATEAQVDAIPVPEATATYQPVGHTDLITNIRRSAKLFNLEEDSSKFALGRNGDQMFMLLNLKSDSDIGMSIVARNSYDQSMSVGIAAGSRVFICDNMALSGEWAKTHKHTRRAWDELYAFLYGAFPALIAKHDSFIHASDTWKGSLITQVEADHFVVEACRRNALPATDILPVLKEYETPSIGAWADEHKSVWRLYNAATQIAKKWSPILQLDRTRKLTSAFTELAGI